MKPLPVSCEEPTPDFHWHAKSFKKHKEALGNGYNTVPAMLFTRQCCLAQGRDSDTRPSQHSSNMMLFPSPSAEKMHIKSPSLKDMVKCEKAYCFDFKNPQYFLYIFSSHRITEANCCREKTIYYRRPRRKGKNIYMNKTLEATLVRQIIWVQDAHASKQSPTINQYAPVNLLRSISKPWLPYCLDDTDYLHAPNSEYQLTTMVLFFLMLTYKTTLK